MVLFNISFLHSGPVVPTWTSLLGATFNCFLQNNFNLHTYSESCCLYSFIFSLHYQMRSLLAIALKFCYNSKQKKEKKTFFALNWSPAPFSLDNEEYDQLCKRNDQWNHFINFSIMVVKHLISICKTFFSLTHVYLPPSCMISFSQLKPLSHLEATGCVCCQASVISMKTRAVVHTVVTSYSKSNYTNSWTCTYQTGKASILPASYLVRSVKYRIIYNGKRRTVDLFKQSTPPLWICWYGRWLHQQPFSICLKCRLVLESFLSFTTVVVDVISSANDMNGTPFASNSCWFPFFSYNLQQIQYKQEQNTALNTYNTTRWHKICIDLSCWKQGDSF